MSESNFLQSYSLIFDKDSYVTNTILTQIYVKLHFNSNGINKFKKKLLDEFKCEKLKINGNICYKNIKYIEEDKIINTNTNITNNTNDLQEFIIKNKNDIKNEIINVVKTESIDFLKNQLKSYFNSKTKNSNNNTNISDNDLKSEIETIIKKLMIVRNNIKYTNNKNQINKHVQSLNNIISKEVNDILLNKEIFVKDINKIKSDMLNRKLINCTICSKQILLKNSILNDNNKYFEKNKTFLLCSNECVNLLNNK